MCEALFKDHIEDVRLLKNAKNLDYSTILKRLTQYDLFDIADHIAQTWHLPQNISSIIQASSGIKPSTDALNNTLGKWMHLLLFFELSQAKFVEAGLNDFIEFNVEYVGDIYEDFMQVIAKDMQ